MKLYPHQIEGLKQTGDHPNCALYWDMGLGKTFGGSEKMREYGNRVNLIICQKSKINDWVDHMKTHHPDRIQVYDLTKPKEFLDFCGVAIGDKFRVVGIINYELAWRRKDLKGLRDFTLMLDESSLIQNRKAKQTKFILNLKPKNVILLSGTPTAGKYENLWTQAHLLGWNISEDLYNRQYVNWKTIESDGFFHKVVDTDDPYKNVERLKQKFRDHGAVFMKTEDVFDLPGQTFTMVKVPTSKEYRKFIKSGYVQMPDGSELIGDQVFTKRLHARQLCGMYSTAKLEAFKELIQSTNDRVIVFYNFKEEARQLIQIANELKRPWGIISGDHKLLAPYENYDNSITFIQYAAGSLGLNLQKSNKIIYFSPTDRVDFWMQSQKRIHRIGQEKPCFYYQMTCTGSVEEKIYDALERGVDYTDDLFIETLS